MTPTVTVSHWDPDNATTTPPQEWGDRDTSLYERVKMDHVLPVCPECEREVVGYAYPGSDGEDVQTSIPEWKTHVVIFLRPCNHQVEPERIGLQKYETQTRLTNAPRP